MSDLLKAEAEALVKDSRELCFVEMELNLWKAELKPGQVKAFLARKHDYENRLAVLQLRLQAVELRLGKGGK